MAKLKNGLQDPSNRHPGFPKQTSGNPKGSTQKVRIIKSPLRKTADSLREVEQDALESIKKAVRGEKVEDDQLSTSKWVISTIMQIDKAASSEEISNAKIRMEAKKSMDDGAGPDDVHSAEVIQTRFRTYYTPPEESEDED